MQTLSIVVPCYNEEESLPQLFLQLRQLRKQLSGKYVFDVVFVDDGSADRTFSMLSGFKREFARGRDNVTLCRHPVNRNLGAALKTGLAQVKGELVATVDADCTYSLLGIPALIKLLDDKTDIAIASPYHPDGRSDIRPAYRLFLSKAISKIYALLTGSDLHTFTAIFRVYRRKVIDVVRPKSDGFLAVTEMLVFSLRRGFKVRELPATLTVRKYGRSKMKLLSTIWAHFSFIVRLLLGSGK